MVSMIGEDRELVAWLLEGDQLYKSHRNGQVAIRTSTRFPQLPQWHS